MEERNYIIYKPFGYLSQFINNQNRRKNKKLLGEFFDSPQDLMAIGRLDEDSEGLLLITTNGVLSERVRSKHIEKEYYVQVDGVADEQHIDILKRGVEIGIHGKKYTTLPCQARLIDDPKFEERSRKVRDSRHGPSSWISITISEGKFRQVRKMTAAVGLPTLRLVRVRIGSLELNGLNPGEIIENKDSFKKVFEG